MLSPKSLGSPAEGRSAREVEIGAVASVKSLRPPPAEHGEHSACFSVTISLSANIGGVRGVDGDDLPQRWLMMTVGAWRGEVGKG